MKRAWVAVVLAVMAVDCGYKLAGRGSLPATIRRISVPTFENLSQVPELDRLVSEAVRLELLSRANVTVVQDSAGADAILTGTIVSVNRQPAAVTSDTGLASSYLINVVVSGELKEVKPNTVYWKDSITAGDQYATTAGSASTDIATMFTQDRNALERIAKEVAKKLVAAILQKF